jgi:hypothetical protein
MHNRAILLESNRLEHQLINLQIEGALLEVMKNDFMARAIIAEHRKIEKYALQLGLIDKRQLNEGLGMDIALGVGQAVGSIPGLNLSGVGAAFGVAGVLWYGKEMLNSSGFDFAMNLMFCLFSAAAIEPTGIGGEAGTIAKVLKPFAALGEWARSLGTLTFETAAAAYKGLSGVSRALVTGAMKAEGPIMKSFGWIQKTIMPRITTIFESIKGMVKGKPGAEMFGKIAERVSTGATGAFAAVKGGFTSLINFGRTATGNAGAKVAANAKIAAKETAVTAMEVLMKKMPLQTANRILLTLGEKQFSIAGKKCFMDAFVPGRGFSIKFVDVARPQLITAPSLPSFISSVLQTFGKDAAAAIIVKAQTAYPVSAVKLGLEALRPYLGSAPNVAAAV